MTTPLGKFREEHRAKLESALREAERELAELDERREILQRDIQNARSWLGRDDGGVASPIGGRLTLHGAMELVLKEHPEGLRVPELASAIEERDLYRRRDNLPPGPHQVHARVHNYPQLFRRENGRIFLQADEGRAIRVVP